MKILNFLKKNKQKDKELLKQYEDGFVLKVDGETDNKEYFKKLKEKNDEDSRN